MQQKKQNPPELLITQDKKEIDSISLKKRPIIEIKNLSKHYKDKKAVDDVSLKIFEGDAFGFIGPNGAGKTTTIKILATLLEPTKGEIYIDGMSVLDEPEYIRKVIGFMPDYFGIYNGMKIWEYLDFFADAYLTPAQERINLINDVLEITDLGDKKDMFVEALSKGMRQRLGVAKTLLHDPKVLILDEPASGLDPRARIELKELLKELTRMGKTIFISSHILPELSDICNSIGIIEAGKLLAHGSVKDFVNNLPKSNIHTIRIKSLNEPEKLKSALKENKKIIQVEETSQGGFVINFSGSQEEICILLEELIERKIKIIEFFEKTTDLEDIFLRVTKGVLS